MGSQLELGKGLRGRGGNEKEFGRGWYEHPAEESKKRKVKKVESVRGERRHACKKNKHAHVRCMKACISIY